MNARVLALAAATLVCALALAACQSNPRQAETADPHADAGTPLEMPHPPVANDPGLEWNVPGRWSSEPASGMRLATYTVPGPDGSGEAQCVVFYFGPGQGGGVDANIDRWIGEFENAASPERSSKNVKGVAVTRIKVKGDYLGHASMGSTPAGDGKNWTLLGAIAEGPSGSIFYKFTGPTATVAGAEKEFDGMLASLDTK